MADEQQKKPEAITPASVQTPFPPASSEPQAKPAKSKRKPPLRRADGTFERVFSNKKTENEFFKALRVTGSVTKAAKYAGVDRYSVYRERQNNSDFAAKVEKALAELEVKAGESILKRWQYEWRASAWWLERTNHKRYGRKDPTAVTPEMLLSVASGVSQAALEFITDEKARELFKAKLESVLAGVMAAGARDDGEDNDGDEGDGDELTDGPTGEQ